MVEVARKRNLVMRMFEKQANSRVEVNKQVVILPGYSNSFPNVSSMPVQC